MTFEPIPLLDLHPSIAETRIEINAAVARVIDSGRFILGPEVAHFEARLAKRVGVPHAIGVNSGTDALAIGLRALGVKPEDEVLVPAFTFYATAEAVNQVGATPVFVDVEPDTLCMDPNDLERKVTDSATAVIPVHLFGHPAAMPVILKVAKKHNLKVLEDAAQAIDASLDGMTVGSMGDAGAFSFFPSKNLGAFGDGGLISCKADKVDNEARSLRLHGARDGHKYDNVAFGYNSRLDAIQAAILDVQLDHLEYRTKLRQDAAMAYTRTFRTCADVQCPVIRDGANHVFHQYTIRIDAERRDVVRAALDAAQIGNAVYYERPLHRLAVYNQPDEDAPVATQASTEVLSLPMGPHMDAAKVERVTEVVLDTL